MTSQQGTPESEPGTVTIAWSEIRYYQADVPLSELADAVGADGEVSKGYPLPADLSALEGDPFNHGDLNGLLSDLELDHLRNVDNIEVTSVIMKGSG